MAEKRVEGFISGEKGQDWLLLALLEFQLLRVALFVHFGGATGILGGIGEGDMSSPSLLGPFPELCAKRAKSINQRNPHFYYTNMYAHP